MYSPRALWWSVVIGQYTGPRPKTGYCEAPWRGTVTCMSSFFQIYE